jgi:hypothetical protein
VEHNENVMLAFSDGSTESVTLTNDNALSAFNFDARVATFVRITVDTVYATFNNGAAEIEYYGVGGPSFLPSSDVSDSSDPHRGNSATELSLTQDSHVDIAASTIGDFGSSDFSIQFTFTGNGVDDITPDGNSGALFIRSSEVDSPYTGPTAFIWDNGDIKFQMRADDFMMCSGALPEPKSAAARELKFTVVQSTLSLAIDGVQWCSKTMTKTADPSKFVSAPLRFGGNHVNPDVQNLRAKLSVIKLDDGSGSKQHCCPQIKPHLTPPHPPACLPTRPVRIIFLACLDVLVVLM